MADKKAGKELNQKKENNNEKTLEEAFAKLDSIVEELEQEQISLEDSFQKYKQGIDLLQYCNEKIDTVEKKILVLEEGGQSEL